MFQVFEKVNGPTVGDLNAESPKRSVASKSKKQMVAKDTFRARICTSAKLHRFPMVSACAHAS